MLDPSNVILGGSCEDLLIGHRQYVLAYTLDVRSQTFAITRIAGTSRGR
jgi:hypothetical protein